MPSPNNVNKSIPAIPVDGNKRQASAVMLPIVNGSGTIVNYLPIKCTDNGDGTATLDVGLALNGEIDIGNVNILNTSNAKINPATEETLAEIKTAIDEINADVDATLSSRATEATLGQVKTNLDDVKTKLDTLNAKDFATQATLAQIKTAIDEINTDIDATLSSRATEATLGQVKTNLDDVKTKLDTLNAKDFATQATLATRASEATLELVRLLLAGQLKIGSSDGQTSANKFIAVDSSGRVLVTAGGVVSPGNSTTTPLGIGATFTGTAESCLSISHIIIMVKSDQPSATKGLKVEVSADGTTWNTLEEFTVPANKLKVYTLGPAGAFFRVRYTNNSVAQSSFLLQTTLKPFSQKASTHVISDSIADEDDAELVKAVITGVTETGVFKNAKVSDDGFLKVVLPPPTAPSGSTSVQTLADSSMSGTVDTLYVIPNGSTLKIQQLRAGSQRTTSGGTKVELYYDPAGTGVGMTLIDKLYTDGSSANSALDIEFVGDGTRAIRLRRVNFGGGSVEIFAAWRGYI